MPRREPQALIADVVLTQYGELDGAPVFRNILRHEIGETELSLIVGSVDADAASMLVTKTLAQFRTCRTTTGGSLRNAGFGVEHSPTKGNPLHVSVYSPTLATGEPAEWDASLAKLFDDCFTLPERDPER
jgi:hypothetical protein